MSAHTPGPWEAGCPPFSSADPLRVWRANGKADLIATARLEADARLIAAAPDLLAALQMFDRWPDAYRQDGLRAAYEAARAAIAKAEGK